MRLSRRPLKHNGLWGVIPPHFVFDSPVLTSIPPEIIRKPMVSWWLQALIRFKLGSKFGEDPVDAVYLIAFNKVSEKYSLLSCSLSNDNVER